MGNDSEWGMERVKEEVEEEEADEGLEADVSSFPVLSC